MKKDEPTITIVQTRTGPVVMRSDCGCALCRAYFKRPARPDTAATSAFRRACRTKASSR